MDVSYILDPLNDAQREAVTAPGKALLVLAGAGSGKTRVLVHRIAWLVRVAGVSPYAICAVTFTNKAAGEMRHRTEELLGMPTGAMWVGTFHGLAHRLLRIHWADAGLPHSFQILDGDDQLRVIKRILRELELDEARHPPRQLQGLINDCKDQGLRSNALEERRLHSHPELARVYPAYELACRRSGQIDFAELLLRAYELLHERPDLLAYYRERIQHLLVDEFQDTNAIQYAWLHLLRGEHGHIFAVGDDDQSIYGWRGARIENLLSFPRDFPDAQVVRMEQNYRSTSTILRAANALIAHNDGRLGKELWTDKGKGEPIRLYAAYTETDEARFVVDRIREWCACGNGCSDAAILYRSNAQSRQFEEALIGARIPYRVYGGLRFFERAEIKDALAYLRLLANRHDDASFERVINVPARGIGERTLGEIRQQARHDHCSLWQGATALLAARRASARATQSVTGFLALIDALARECAHLELFERVVRVIERTVLARHYEREGAERAQIRRENLDELVNAARQFESELPPGIEGLDAFLAHAALEAGEGQGDTTGDCVQLMTLHSAKGLEFPLVFLSGLEEGLFPHQRSRDEARRLEEERRLCYVGMTRAMRQLYVTYAESRRLHGREARSVPSRFLGELPPSMVEEVRSRVRVRRPLYRSPVEGQSPFYLGQRVRHAKFGEGTILTYEGNGAHARVEVNFEGLGSKWLVVSYANLQGI